MGIAADSDRGVLANGEGLVAGPPERGLTHVRRIADIDLRAVGGLVGAGVQGAGIGAGDARCRGVQPGIVAPAIHGVGLVALGPGAISDIRGVVQALVSARRIEPQLRLGDRTAREPRQRIRAQIHQHRSPRGSRSDGPGVGVNQRLRPALVRVHASIADRALAGVHRHCPAAYGCGQTRIQAPAVRQAGTTLEGNDIRRYQAAADCQQQHNRKQGSALHSDLSSKG